MLFKKLFRTIGLYKAQFISMIVMIALGIGIFLGFNMEWYTIKVNVEDFQNKTGLSDFQLISNSGFTSADLDKITEIDGISDASRFVSLRCDVKDSNKHTLQLTVTENEKVSGFMLIDGEEYDRNSTDGIWLSDKYASKNDIKLGDEIALNYNGFGLKSKVVGLVKSGEYTVCISDKTQIIPDHETHGFAYISPKMYEEKFGSFAIYPQINVKSEMEKKDFSEKVNDALGKTTMLLSKDENISYAGPQGEIEEGQTMGAILPAIFLMIAVLTMVTTMHRLASKEKVQIGTMKALGIKDRKILLHYASFSLIISLIGVFISAFLGYAIAYLVMDPNGGFMAVYIDMPTWNIRAPIFCYFTILGLVVAMMLIGVLSVKTMLKGNAAEALRPYTPKKIKPMLIEKAKFFHKLSFGTRWNLRDTVRHKSRTFMSVFGTLGCILIMLASFGMMDTVNLMYDRYYENGINYKTRIFVEDGEDLIDTYKGDAGGSVSVQIEDEAVSLDIYRLKADKVRFINTDMDYINLSDDGVYICKRISEDYKLKVGDTFEVKPFGTDVVYNLKVAGIISSFAKSITMTENYAKAQNIDYKIDSIYTDTDKSDIVIGGKITGVQTKESIVKAFETMLGTMSAMIWALVIIGIVLGVVVLYNLGVMSYTERYRELATLKVVGFNDKKLSSILIGQNMAVTVFGVIFGIPLAHIVLYYLLKALTPEYEMKSYISLSSHLLSIGITLCVSALVSYMLSRKNRKIDMVESLKNGD